MHWISAGTTDWDQEDCSQGRQRTTGSTMLSVQTAQQCQLEDGSPRWNTVNGLCFDIFLSRIVPYFRNFVIVIVCTGMRLLEGSILK